MKIWVYPGSFDPITNGHFDIIERASILCDKLYVAALVNNSKKPFFEMDEKVELIRDTVSAIKNVEVQSFSGLLIDFVKKIDASVIIKGLRAVSDFEYELQMALLNKNQNPDIETLFMMTSLSYSFLSSSSVRDLAKHGGNIDGLVPERIKDRIYKRMSEF